MSGELWLIKGKYFSSTMIVSFRKVNIKPAKSKLSN